MKTADDADRRSAKMLKDNHFILDYQRVYPLIPQPLTPPAKALGEKGRKCTEVVCLFGESKIVTGFVSRAAPKGSHNKRWLPDARASRLTTAKAPGEKGRK